VRVWGRSLDRVYVQGWVSDVETLWEHRLFANFLRRLSAMSRLICFDKRGTGLSDQARPDDLPDLETRSDDVRAVLDAVGSEQAVLFGVSEGGPIAEPVAEPASARRFRRYLSVRAGPQSQDRHGGW